MIPPQISAKAPGSERLLYQKLKEDPTTREWIVFHSFDIRRHIARTQGEADLVVAVPGLGVLCIEVKGCGLQRRDGLWIYQYDPPKISTVGPFRQASDAAHSVRKYVMGRDATLANIVFTSAVFFTEIDFTERSLEWEPWQVVNKTDLLRNPVSSIVTRILEAEHTRLRNTAATRTWYSPRSRPNRRQVESIVSVLRPDFEYAAIGNDKDELVERSIRKFTEEQFHALDMLEDNRRILFKGPAGTGKTLLAIEAARRVVRSGRRVMLLCHNSLLGNWLKGQTESIAAEAQAAETSMSVGTVSSLLLRIAGIEVPIDAGKEFWSSELPERALNALLRDDSQFKPFDMLILDEAQDLMTEEILDVLELIIAGGLAGGRWAMFGDFERQAIYANSNAQPGLERLKSRSGQGFTTCPIRINCRNTRNIADAVTLTSGLTPGYSRVLQSEEGVDVAPIFYRNQADQDLKLADSLRQLSRRYGPDGIVVLSMRTDAAACAARLKGVVDKVPVLPFGKTSNSAQAIVHYGSVYAYKGMESPVVILTDVEELDGDQAAALLYVGMTRARLALHVLMNERLRSVYGRLLIQGLKAQREGSA
ncbi:nuclease-related domain-containing DEAD/DEAH box helicase [Burkholderia stabilis]|uniref:nuclease-related domain-containing DEAD/DEAH box helicase n=1 Tax=Burkholderia stabilis TaxID=95485 RepID=UPI001F4AAEA2|nr:ATP-binding domain-containing protein [Burkholderia stabilis]